MTKLKFHDQRDINLDIFADRLILLLDQEQIQFHDVLDLGMGNGYLVRRFRCFGKNAIGVNVRDFGCEGYKYADVRELPFENESFDLVTDIYYQSDLLDLQKLPISEVNKAAIEARRVLRPNSYLSSCPFIIRVPQQYFSRMTELKPFNFYQK